MGPNTALPGVHEFDEMIDTMPMLPLGDGGQDLIHNLVGVIIGIS